MRFEEEFEPTVDSIKLARRFAAAALGAWDLDDLDEVACLLTGELAANAVRHAGTVYRVVVALEPPEIEVGVFDGSPVLPAVSSAVVTGSTLQVSFEGSADRVIKLAAHHEVRAVRPREDDLEEIFLRYYREQPASNELPSSAGGSTQRESTESEASESA